MKNLIIITGTTQGLGKEFEKILLEEENYIISINRKKLQRNKDNLSDLCIDLSNIQEENILEFKNIINSIDEVKHLIFINNAFTINPLSKISSLNNKEIISSFHTNIISSIILLKEFINIKKDVKKTILNISSGAAKHPIKDWSIYCTTKASVEMFLRCIEKEYPKIDIHNIDPGVLDTTMQETIRSKCPDNLYFKELKENKQLLTPKSVALRILKETKICL